MGEPGVGCDCCDQEAVWVHASSMLWLCGGHHAELSAVEQTEWLLISDLQQVR